jgi:hypothetical protein
MPVRVRTGASDGVNTEIRDGLKEGEVIVRAGGESDHHWGNASPFQQNTKGGGGGGRRGG